MRYTPKITDNPKAISSPGSPAHPSAWASLWQTIVRFQKEKVSPWMALRNALGVGLTLAAGIAYGSVPGGLILATGALNVAFSDGQEPYIIRGRRMLASSVLVGTAVFAGSLCAHHNVIAVVVATAWAFVAGLLVALGPTAADLGSVSLVVLVVYAAVPMSPEKAALSGFLAFMGGVFQTLLAVAFWPIDRYAPERRALGDFYLGAFPRCDRAHPARRSRLPPPLKVPRPVTRWRRSIPITPYRPSGTVPSSSQAERMRLSLLTLGRLRVRIHREDPSSPAIAILDRYFQLSSSMMGSLGGSLAAGEPARTAPESLQELQTLAEQLREAKQASASVAAMLRDARFQMDALVRTASRRHGSRGVCNAGGRNGLRAARSRKTLESSAGRKRGDIAGQLELAFRRFPARCAPGGLHRDRRRGRPRARLAR